MASMKKLNWRDDPVGGSTAHAARNVGGKYEIRRRGGPKEPRCGWDPVKPFYFRVEWGEEHGGPRWWGQAMTPEQAKALAERAHELAQSATREHVRAADLAAGEAHKKAPHEPADFRERMEQAIHELNPPRAASSVTGASSLAEPTAERIKKAVP
jgi:hypothetical protein